MRNSSLKIESKGPVVIVGGGLSGLVLANYLAKEGYSVKVIEKRSNPTISDYGDCRSINLTLSPRGLCVLRALGLEAKVQSVAVPVTGRSVHRKDHMVLEQSYGGAEKLCLWAVRRSDLNKILVQSLSEQPTVELLFEHEFKNYDKKRNILSYKNISSEKTIQIAPSFCVGADGAFSQLRQQLFKGEMANFTQEFFSWSYKQFDINREFALTLDPHQIHVWSAEDALIIAIANTDGTFNCNLFLERSSTMSFNSLNKKGISQFLSEKFPELSEIAHDIAIQLSKNPECGITRNEISPWYFKDQAVLIGDACHATYHFFAQGLNAALEDCQTLIEQLRVHTNRKEAFESFQQLRKAHTDTIAELSEKNFFTLKNEVSTQSYHARHLLDSFLHGLLGKFWEPMYLMVAQGKMGYCEAKKRAQLQKTIWRFTGMGVVQWILSLLLRGRDLFSANYLSYSSRKDEVVHSIPWPSFKNESVKTHAILSGVVAALIFVGNTVRAETKKVTVAIASTLADVGTNSSIPHGDFFRRGVKRALEDQKSELKKKGIEIDIREYDYGNSRMNVIDIARQAIKSDAVAVIGYNFSDHALLAAPLHQEAELAMITPTATADRVATFGPYVHQMSFSNSFQAQLLAKLASENLSAKRVAAVVAQDCTYCRDLEQDFKKAYLTKSGHEFATLPVLKGDSDFEDVVKEYKAKKQKFDLIFIPNHELTSAKIILAFLKAGIKGPFLGGDGWANYGGRTFQSMFSDWSFKAYAISHWDEKMENALSKRFLAEYESEYHSTPNMTAAMAYDSMRYLIQGILGCESMDRKSVEACLSKIENFDGVTGHYRFRKNLSPEKSLVLQEFKKNKFEFMKVVSP